MFLCFTLVHIFLAYLEYIGFKMNSAMNEELAFNIHRAASIKFEKFKKA